MKLKGKRGYATKSGVGCKSFRLGFAWVNFHNRVKNADTVSGKQKSIVGNNWESVAFYLWWGYVDFVLSHNRIMNTISWFEVAWDAPGNKAHEKILI